ncbi:GntR family transcriptional regulator [Streptomyces pacificus]|uniref:UTRA domain-containing protein n=1 Tax=Streptomyces pacificus TaxID=2705029 RepID=A0A6A0AMX1_9ACTN|nr:GntR family transcriptional regulator [Streptomyces pacificus]GFH34319.1 UTRA domain-containing protein [Streptomyces pacificus]
MPRKPGEPLKYMEVADDLRRRIGEGEFPPGSKLPPERKLVEQYSRSPGTIRQALAVLREEGITESRVGSGVTVRQWRPIVRNALKRVLADQWGEGKSIWDVDIEDRTLIADGVRVEQLRAEPDVAAALGIEQGELVCRRDRRYLVDGVPVLRATSFISDDLARGTRIMQHDTGDGGVFARLAEVGHKPARFREDLRCRMPSAREVEDLRLPPSTPVVELVRYAYDSADRVVEVNRMILDASRYLLRYDFSS